MMERAVFRAFRRRHWRHYAFELLGLAWVMTVAGVVASVLWYPASPVAASIHAEWARRLLMGLAMGAALTAFIYSPWGRASGAHINPAVTLAFYRLGKIRPVDTVFYVMSQFVGGVLGVGLAAAIMRTWFSSPQVNYIVTTPGYAGSGGAFLGEVAITFVLMLMVLVATNSRAAKLTGIFAGTMLALLILLESPISGTSLNPARSFGSAAVARSWSHLWLYFVAPPIGGLLAVFAYGRFARRRAACAKLSHPESDPGCIFVDCAYRRPGPTGDVNEGGRG